MSVERVRKLLAMTTAAGCTEAEALAAAEKAARLMAEMGVELGDLQFDASRAKLRAGWTSARSCLWTAIATCTNTAPITLDGEIEYVGRAPWPEVATYLHEVTDRAISRELREFKATRWFRRRSSLRAARAASFDFTIAMARRLSWKLEKLFGATISRPAIQLAIAERDRRYSDATMESTQPRRGTLKTYSQAVVAGLSAGSNVEISHAVGGGAAVLRIGGGS